MQLEEFRRIYQRIVEQVQSVVVGQERVIHLLLTSVLAEGHVILTGVPGLGRTLIAETLGRVLGLEVNRIQFTPDLLPTDVTGTEVIDLVGGQHQYRFVPGPVFANLVLADEINRSPARTQSALLEAMQERQVTVNGKVHSLKRPFLVVATQNAVDTEGVYPLPEAQLDRFMMQIEMQYPTEEAEKAIVDATTSVRQAKAEAVTSKDTVVAMQEFAKLIPVPQTVKEFAVDLVRSSRRDRTAETAPERRRSKRYWWGGLRKPDRMESMARFVRWGASPRAGQALLRAAKVRAIVQGRAYVTRDDILDVFPPILTHRVILDHRAGARGMTSQVILDGLAQEVCTRWTPQPTSSRMRRLLLSTKR